MKHRPLMVAASAALSVHLLSACTEPRSEPGRPQAETFRLDPAGRRPLFGDLHLHTTYSLDAFSVLGTRTTPDQAYRFARGETVPYLGHKVRRDEPLDFMAVTDHAEYLGQINELDDPKSPISMSELGRRFRENPRGAFRSIIGRMGSVTELNVPGVIRDTWAREVAAANENYRPGRFTTFIGFEWTSVPSGGQNLHRNVIFEGSQAPELPYSSADSQRPEDLWTYIEGARKRGMEALAIPHNANASGGLMFGLSDSDGQSFSTAYGRRRSFNEPLTEIYQIKGQSETMPYLSAADEFADFEVMEQLLGGGPSEPHGSYVREALGRGLEVQSRTGANPFKLGFVGGTDSHSGLSTSAEDSFAGGELGIDPATDLPDKAAAQDILAPNERSGRGMFRDATISGSGGLTGVWAEENNRPAIYAALRRRETFATSGPKLRVRMFGGWDFPSTLMGRPDWVRTAYAAGVPIGGDLPSSAARCAPRFAVWAARDPNGANLERLQVVKVWLENGQHQERVFDVALSRGRSAADPGAARRIDPAGEPVLKALWTDPAFDRRQAAVYYARVLQTPTPRWTFLLARKRGLAPPPQRPREIQERGWTSPIWYAPGDMP